MSTTHVAMLAVGFDIDSEFPDMDNDGLDIYDYMVNDSPNDYNEHYVEGYSNYFIKEIARSEEIEEVDIATLQAIDLDHESERMSQLFDRDIKVSVFLLDWTY